MPDLPARAYRFYGGIDPGFTGAIVAINQPGTSVRVWDMPVHGGRGRHRELDLDKLQHVYRQLTLLPDLVLGIEWPTTRPGEGSERCERFGRQKGILHAFAWLFGLPCCFVSPQLWKGRLGLPGKGESQAVQRSADYFDRYYPDHTSQIRGPKGGIKDGRVDALLIAHFLRTSTVAGMQSVVDRFGKGSAEAQALMLGAGRGKQKNRKKNSGPPV
jgi:hypothetical protein